MSWSSAGVCDASRRIFLRGSGYPTAANADFARFRVIVQGFDRPESVDPPSDGRYHNMPFSMKLGFCAMRPGRVFLAAILLVAFAGESVQGQSHRGQQTLGRQGVGKVETRGSVSGGRDPLSLRDAKLSRYQGLVTRRDQIQRILTSTSPSYQRRQAIASQRRNPSVSEMMLEQRNLLSVRSKFGKMVSRTNPYAELPEPSEIEAEKTIPADPLLAPGPMSHMEYIDHLSDRLAQQADEYYELGMAHFRKGDFLKAKNYFAMDREVNREHPRGFLADVLTAGERRDVNRAYASLILGLRRAQSVDELKIDKAAFFPDERRFERTLSIMNVVANQSPDQPAGYALMAYYSFLHGDVGATRAALNKARELSATPSGQEPLDRFKALIESGKVEPSASAAEVGGR